MAASSRMGCTAAEGHGKSMTFDPDDGDPNIADLSMARDGGLREVELKLELEPGGTEALLDHPLLRDILGDERQNDSVYYDTRKGALRSAGVSLRVRRSGERFVQTVKSDGKAGAGLFDRSEWEQSVSGPGLDLDKVHAAGPILQAPEVRHALKPVFETRIRRRACTLDRDGSRIELVVDRGEVVAGRKTQPIFEVELELIEGRPSALFDLARELHKDVPVRLGVMSKSERGARLASGKSSRATKAEPVILSPDMSVADGFRTIALACMRHFRANEPLIISARDVDALHQGRVALRRLRSAFSLFKPVLPGSAFEGFREGLRNLSGTMGVARNLDVLLERRSEDLSKDSRRLLMEQRSRAYDDTITALKSSQVRAMMIDLVEWITLGDSVIRDDAIRQRNRPLKPYAQSVLDRFWRKVRKRGRIVRDLDDEDRHELRIAAKKLRYAGEFFAGLYADAQSVCDRDAFLAAMVAMQDGLGDLNDIATERSLAKELALFGITLPRRKAGNGRPAKSALIAASDKSYRRLADVGPYWR